MRIDANDGSIVDFDVATPGVQPDGNLAYAVGDPNAAADPALTGSGYTNSFAGATSTTLYGIDSGLDVLVIQSSPNNGTLNTVGGLGVDASNVVGFDLLETNVARAALVVWTSRLYDINLTTACDQLECRRVDPCPRSRPVGYAHGGRCDRNISRRHGLQTCARQLRRLLRHNRLSLGEAVHSDFDFASTTRATDPLGERRVRAVNSPRRLRRHRVDRRCEYAIGLDRGELQYQRRSRARPARDRRQRECRDGSQRDDQSDERRGPCRRDLARQHRVAFHQRRRRTRWVRRGFIARDHDVAHRGWTTHRVHANGTSLYVCSTAGRHRYRRQSFYAPVLSADFATTRTLYGAHSAISKRGRCRTATPRAAACSSSIPDRRC